jgi:hypothetical protein
MMTSKRTARWEIAAQKVAKTITGELFRVEDGNYFVKVKGGKEVRLHTDTTTQMVGEIKKGDRIEAKMNDQHHALSIRSVPKTDARQEIKRFARLKELMPLTAVTPLYDRILPRIRCQRPNGAVSLPRRSSTATQPWKLWVL